MWTRYNGPAPGEDETRSAYVSPVAQVMAALHARNAGSGVTTLALLSLL